MLTGLVSNVSVSKIHTAYGHFCLRYAVAICDISLIGEKVPGRTAGNSGTKVCTWCRGLVGQNMKCRETLPAHFSTFDFEFLNLDFLIIIVTSLVKSKHFDQSAKVTV